MELLASQKLSFSVFPVMKGLVVGGALGVGDTVATND